MSEHILIAPLGFSPGAVSGLAFALMEADHPISQVITLGTSHPDVIASAQILKTLFYEMGDMAYTPLHIRAKELREEDDSANSFVSQMGLALKEANKDGNTVHVGVTGGRSGMGALAALATNLYGADHLWHFWVSEDIEKGGRLRDLPQPFTMDNRFLNPTVEDGAYEIVELPFVDLRPLHPLIWEYYRNGRFLQDSPLSQLLTQSQAKRLQDIFPPELSITKADELTAIIQAYPTLNRDEQNKSMVQLGRILSTAGVIKEATEGRLLKLIQADLPADQILTLPVKDEDKKGFLKSLQENSDLIAAAASVGGLIIKGVELWLKGKGYP